MTSATLSTLGAAWQVVQYLFLFGLVLALAYVASRSLHRLAPSARSRHLRLLDQLHLGTTRSFYLLAVAGKVVLVAMGEGGVATVATVDDPEQVADLLRQADAPAEAPTGPAADFLRQTGMRLREAWRRNGGLGMEQWRLHGQGAGQPRHGFAELLRRVQDGAGAPPAARATAESAALRRQVERLRKLVGRTEG